MNEAALARINEMLQFYSLNPSGFTRADMDELSMLVGNSRNQLPERLLALISEFESKFTMQGTSRNTFLERAVRILEVHAKYPSVQQFGDDPEITPTFILNDSDKSRVIDLCADMRKIVQFSNIFDAAHKRRLLNRISAIEKQVHQKNGTFDTVLAGMSDFGEALGKFGKDVKPLTDRFGEVMRITRAKTSEYDQLPAPDEVKQSPRPGQS